MQKEIIHNELRELYRKLLLLQFKDERCVFDRLNSEDLCIAGHHIGRLFDNGLLIVGQAMNGWQNENLSDVDSLISTLFDKAEDYKELYPLADYSGWHGMVDGKEKSYYYKRSNFWKLNYLVATNAEDESFNKFYIDDSSESEKEERLYQAWPQNVAWSNLYKVSFSKGGNPDTEIIRLIKDISLQIIIKEIQLLEPSRVLFNTGENYFADIAISAGNIFGLSKMPNDGNVLYSGCYEYLPKKRCKMIVCKRPDAWKPRYKNSDIVREANEILETYEML